MSASEVIAQCEFCQGPWRSEHPIQIQYVEGNTETTLSLCGWHCVFAVALTQLKQVTDKHYRDVARLQEKVEELEHILLHVRAQAGT